MDIEKKVYCLEKGRHTCFIKKNIEYLKKPLLNILASSKCTLNIKTSEALPHKQTANINWEKRNSSAFEVA